MKRLSKVQCLTVLFVAVSACAPVQAKLQEVQLPPQRIFQKGYSLMPLNEKGWLLSERNAYQLVIGKQGESADETQTIQATLIKLSAFTTSEEFLLLVKEGQAKDTDPRRFKIVTHEVTAYPDKGSNCAKSHLVADDYTAVKRSDKPGPMRLELLILTCAHPADKSIGVNVAYSQRSYPEQQNSGFLVRALSVFDSVALEDF